MQRPTKVKEFFSKADSEKRFATNDYLYGTSGKQTKDISPSQTFDKI